MKANKRMGGVGNEAELWRDIWHGIKRLTKLTKPEKYVMWVFLVEWHNLVYFHPSLAFEVVERNVEDIWP